MKIEFFPLHIIINFLKETCQLYCTFMNCGPVKKLRITFFVYSNNMIVLFFAVHQVLKELYPWGTTRVCPLLWRKIKKDFCEWNTEPAPKLAGVTGHQIQETSHASNNFYGWKHKDTVGWFCHNGKRTLSAIIGENRPAGSVWIFSVHSFVWQGQYNIGVGNFRIQVLHGWFDLM